jgi:DNA modification methylase
MYMTAVTKSKSCTYNWGPEPGHGTAEEYWQYHDEIYQECRRVLKLGGTLAWAVGAKHKRHFRDWFGGHRLWGFSRFLEKRIWKCRAAYGHAWMVQTREQEPIRFPDEDGLLIIGPRGWWRHHHPCPKSVEEMRFLVRHLTQPGQVVLDPFCGSGTTLVAAAQLGRLYIGVDKDEEYCRVAIKRLARLHR